MTNNHNAPFADPATREGVRSEIDASLGALEGAGIDLVADDARNLLSSIEGDEYAVPALRELARLLEVYEALPADGMEDEPPAWDATATPTQLEQYAWLLENAGNDRSPMRLRIFQQWAEEMAHFQVEANRTGKPVDYIQRGQLLRRIMPQEVEAGFIEGGPFPNVEPEFIDVTPEDEASMRGEAA